MANNKLPVTTAAKVAVEIATLIGQGTDFEDATATVLTMVVSTLVTQHGWTEQNARSAAVSLVAVAVQALDAIMGVTD